MIEKRSLPECQRNLQRQARIAQERGLTPRLDTASMQHARALMADAREHEEQADRVYAELTAALAPAAPTKREAVLQFVAASHEFACVVLRSQSQYPAHVVDFATGLLSEALAYVQADRAASWG